MDAVSLFVVVVFVILFLDGRKPHERLTVKFLWMLLLCARMSSLAHWSSVGYPQHKTSATHVSSCSVVCIAVLSISLPKQPLITMSKLFTFSVWTFPEFFSLFMFLGFFFKTNAKNIFWSLTSVVVDVLCLFMPVNRLSGGLLYFCKQS